MSRRLPIRLRLAATSVVLVVMVLVLTGGVVVALERQSLDDGLAEQASIEARSLLAVASQAEPDPVPSDNTTSSSDANPDDDAVVPDVPEPPDDDTDASSGSTDEPDARSTASGTAVLDASTEPYLVRRGASDNLLAVQAPGSAAVLNSEDARRLLTYLDDPIGTTSTELARGRVLHAAGDDVALGKSCTRAYSACLIGLLTVAQAIQ